MKPQVDNFDLIAPLLNWDIEGQYYYCQLILRKKDGATTFGNKNNSARIVKSYCFFNLEQFLAKKKEIVTYCNTEGCRAGINLNKRYEERVTYELLKQLTDRIISKNFKGINGILNTVNGAQTSEDKIWLIDCDSEQEYIDVINILTSDRIKPEGDKILGVVPTYSGKHIITKRFDRRTFENLLEFTVLNRGDIYAPIDIHKNNPVALFYPAKND